MFYSLEYGEYALIMAHDKNKNDVHDFDSEGIVKEGIWVMNYENLDSPEDDLTFDKVKFSFDELERTIEAKMLYPPFAELSDK